MKFVMSINIQHLREGDFFELSIHSPRLKSSFLLDRNQLNNVRVLIERALIDSKIKNNKELP